MSYEKTVVCPLFVPYLFSDKRQVELYRRDEHDEWRLAVVSQDEPLLLESAGASLTLDEIYEDVRLDASPARL